MIINDVLNGQGIKRGINTIKYNLLPFRWFPHLLLNKRCTGGPVHRFFSNKCVINAIIKWFANFHLLQNITV